MRVLFADDQIPDDDVPDGKIADAVRQVIPDAREGFIRAFKVMRRARQAVAEDHDVTVASSLDEALLVARTQDFDVAIIDLGWYADLSVPEAERAVARWKIAAALDETDQQHPQRPPTAQIIYSARFGTQPQLAERAASRGRLPFLKPYKEQFTIPLESQAGMTKSEDGVEAACQSLRATLSFIEHVRTSGTSLQDNVQRNLNVLLKTASDGVSRAVYREKQWDSLTRVMLGLSVLIVLTGVVSLFFLGVPQGAVTAAVGIVVGLIPRLMYGELHKTRDEIQAAMRNLSDLVSQAQGLVSESPSAAPAAREPHAS
jgi:hypothetical protein